ncbi:hypothetical protein M758_8G035200 [Ceratodon purpureus]|nr:hypothetical protein M758_8G035200 [Ceratodon purpureus]
MRNCLIATSLDSRVLYSVDIFSITPLHHPVHLSSNCPGGTLRALYVPISCPLIRSLT